MAPRCLAALFALIIGPLYTSVTAQTSDGPFIYSVGQVRLIPDVVGKTFSAATDSLRWTELRIVQLDTVVTSDWVGLVIAQRPKAGTPVSRARAETLYVAVPQKTHKPKRPSFFEELAKAVITTAIDSMRHGEVYENTTKVPDLFGRTPTMASALLRKSQLESGEVVRDYSDNVEPGRVFRQHPLAGTEVVKGSNVTIWYSAGPHPEDTNLRVPSVLGLTLVEAIDSLKRAQLTVGHVDSLTNPGGEGKVLRQNPHEGVTAHSNDAVDLIVVLSPPAKIDTVVKPPAVRYVLVPALTDKSVEEADSALHAARLVLGEVIRLGTDRGDRVTDQQPKAGTRALVQSAVNIALGNAASIAGTFIPDVVNMSVDSARRILTDSGFTRISIDGGGDRVTSRSIVETQQPLGGTAAPFTTMISLVAKNPPPVPVVPDLVGRSKKEARVMADIDSLRMIVTSELRRLRFNDEIVRQTPIAFDVRPSNGTIEVTAEIPVIPPVLAGMLGFTVVAGAGWQALRKKPVKSPKGNVELLSITQPSAPPILDAAGHDTLINAEYALRFDVVTDPVQTDMSNESIVKSSEVTSV